MQSRINADLIQIISNGVQQGAMLSPKLFSIYMNALSNKLVKCDVGCHIGNVCVSHGFYADAVCLMVPCAIGLYSIIVDLNFNVLISFLCCIRP